jgi:hypothetical protein
LVAAIELKLDPGISLRREVPVWVNPLRGCSFLLRFPDQSTALYGDNFLKCSWISGDNFGSTGSAVSLCPKSDRIRSIVESSYETKPWASTDAKVP